MTGSDWATFAHSPKSLRKLLNILSIKVERKPKNPQHQSHEVLLQKQRKNF